MAIVKCKECGKEISSSAAQCPHCGKKRSQDVGAGIVVVALIGCGWFIYEQAKDATSSAPAAVLQTATTPPTANRPIYKTTAEALFSDYNENEVATDQKIGNAIIEISGTIASIDKDIGDHAVLHLQTDNEFAPALINLEDSEKNAAGKLRKGQKIIVRCQKMSRMVMYPTGDACVIVPRS